MSMLNEVIQSILTGLAVGCVYGIVALGFVLIYKATDVINFAQGEMMVLGAFFSYSLITFWNFNYWLALLIAIIATGILGKLFEKIILRPLIGEAVLPIIMLTLGLGYFIRATVNVIPQWGGEIRAISTPFTGKNLSFSGMVLPWEQIAIIVLTTILILILFLFFQYTKIGVAIRATSQNQLGAVYTGISVNNVFSLTWTISGAVGAFAGILIAPITFIHMNMGFIGLKAFPAAVLGGFGSIPGAIVGGVIIGISESLAGLYLPVGWKDIAAWIILIVILIIRPEGIFGRHTKKKV